MERFLVSAATGTMNSLLGKLGTILNNEYKLLKGVRDDIKFLKRELEAMAAFLLRMADMEEPNPQSQLHADDVRELSYDIEDKIDKFMLLVNHESSSQSESFKELLNKCMKKIADIKTRHKIAKDVKDIKSQVKELAERHARYKIDESSKPRNEKVDPRLCAVFKDTTELVGIDAPRDDLVKLLTDEKGESAYQLKVVSIVGTGGLGKTTLARQVYNKIGANFDCRAFVPISRSPDMSKILSSIFSQLRNQDQYHAGAGDPTLLIEQIRKFLENKRYLIVIDDIWDAQTWKFLECAFVKSGLGSRVMSTTRNNDIANACCSCDRDLVYKIKPLSDADSAKLFFKRIFGDEESCPSSLKEVSKDILRKCAGLPLAITAISSLLATGKTEQEWNQVRSSITSVEGKSSDIEAMKYILSLSYFDLPFHLRSCLLYLTMFPEDYEVERKRLVHRWISEGLIRGKDREDLVELGNTYFHELINRCLIQPVEVKYNGKASSCRVHDTVLDFLIYMSDKENFCTLLSKKAKSDRRIRRISLMGNEDPEIIEQLDLSHARSLGAFRPTNQLPSLVKSEALRVLDLRRCEQLAYHVEDIGRLIQLRYLNIRGCVIELPKQIGDLEYLETLITDPNLSVLPESVSRLKRLARLSVGNSTKLPDAFGNMENLQELWEINPFIQSPKFVEELGKLINLMKLKILLRSSRFASYEEKCIVSSLFELDNCNLRKLSITFEWGVEDGFIRDMCFPSLNCVQSICLWHRETRLFAKWLLSLANLQKLRIVRGKIEQQDIEMFGTISTLVKFQLALDSEDPISIIIRSEGFQQLQMFVLKWFNGLKFEAGSMPSLKVLQLLVHVRKLKDCGNDFDFGIQHLASLGSLHVDIFCLGAKAADVEALEHGLKSMVEANPNHPALEIRKLCEKDMLPDE
ncbi:disease resistance protein RGA5-like [Triticum dicoccoides]|uniref:disease resistance protein RGA5-like n=1 Tax=Triticum dicoccoides TaxID=85692 RepID=UPI00188E192E|nr:disease resistance protein RGA5-like [Triticum dicoccoides]